MYYVYALIDPRTDAPFYIGKGKGYRVAAHEAEAVKGGYSPKCNRIREIWIDGEKVVRKIISRHQDENDAFAYEAALIEEIGLNNLTNIMPGGIIGQQVYLERVRKAQEHAQEASRKMKAESFEKMAPKFAWMLIATKETGGFGVNINGEWIELSGVCTKFFWDVVRAVGFEKASGVMRKYGVELRGS